MTPRIALVCAAILMAAAVALGAFGVAVLMTQVAQARGLRHAAWLFVAGIVLFSGSLYALALGAPATVGIVTPFGGVAFIGGWVVLAFTARTLPAAHAAGPR